jgi:hypothetical protein
MTYSNPGKELLSCDLDPVFDDKDLQTNKPPTQIQFAPASDPYMVGRG